MLKLPKTSIQINAKVLNPQLTPTPAFTITEFNVDVTGTTDDTVSRLTFCGATGRTAGNKPRLTI
jgi:hypothetical protein